MTTKTKKVEEAPVSTEIKVLTDRVKNMSCPLMSGAACRQAKCPLCITQVAKDDAEAIELVCGLGILAHGIARACIKYNQEK